MTHSLTTPDLATIVALRQAAVSVELSSRLGSARYAYAAGIDNALSWVLGDVSHRTFARQRFGNETLADAAQPDLTTDLT